jgi:hypothetical protein
LGCRLLERQSHFSCCDAAKQGAAAIPAMKLGKFWNLSGSAGSRERSGGQKPQPARAGISR